MVGNTDRFFLCGKIVHKQNNCPQYFMFCSNWPIQPFHIGSGDKYPSCFNKPGRSGFSNGYHGSTFCSGLSNRNGYNNSSGQGSHRYHSGTFNSNNNGQGFASPSGSHGYPHGSGNNLQPCSYGGYEGQHT